MLIMYHAFFFWCGNCIMMNRSPASYKPVPLQSAGVKVCLAWELNLLYNTTENHIGSLPEHRPYGASIMH